MSLKNIVAWFVFQMVPRGDLHRFTSVGNCEPHLNSWYLPAEFNPAAASIQVPESTSEIRMVCGNAQRTDMFADESFGCVLCNATLEHDARFWLTVAEMRRVTKAGGLIVIGVPGFRGMGPRWIAPPRSFLGHARGAVGGIHGATNLLEHDPAADHWLG